MGTTATRQRAPATRNFDVAIQDQNTPILDFYLINQEGTFTLDGTATKDTNSFDADPGHGISTGDIIELYEETQFFQAIVLNVVTNTITIDSLLDFAFTDLAVGLRGVNAMNVDGSTPVIFRVTPKSLRDGQEWDITRVLIHIQDGTAMDDARFGGLTALTNGVLLRNKNGITQNIFNVKSNSEWALRAFDVVYADRAPAGSFGLRIRRTFGGQAKTGVTIRLTATNNDEFQIIIQDDLTGLEQFHAVAQGHLVLD